MKTQIHAIKKLIKLKQENKLLEDYWIEFTTQRKLFGYNKVVLVGLFKKGIYLLLMQKLVKISQFKNSDSLDNWYKKALNFERLRKKAIEELRSNRKRVEVSLSKNRTTSILDVLR